MKLTSIALVAALLAVSCQSPKSKALNSIDAISAHVVAAQQYAGEVRPHVAEKGVPPLNSLVEELGEIGTQAATVARPNIAKLDNPESWWSRVMGYLKWAVFGLAAIGILFFLGEAKLIPGVGPLIAWLASKGFSLARSATAEAAMLFKLRKEVKAKAPAHLQAKTDAIIAAKRQASPSFDGAYIKLDRIEKGEA